VPRSHVSTLSSSRRVAHVTVAWKCWERGLRCPKLITTAQSTRCVSTASVQEPKYRHPKEVTEADAFRVSHFSKLAMKRLRNFSHSRQQG